MKYGSRSRYVILGVVLLLLMAALIYQLSNVAPCPRRGICGASRH